MPIAVAPSDISILHANLLGLDITLNPDNALSPASIFKAYLLATGITVPSQKFRFSSKTQGIAAQAYYGGRSEVRIRLAQVPAVHTDFVSEYPTVIMLMGLWSFLTAKQLQIKTATQEAKSLLTKVLRKPSLAFDQALWKKFTGYALVELYNDILPIRGGRKAAWLLGSNHFVQPGLENPVRGLKIPGAPTPFRRNRESPLGSPSGFANDFGCQADPRITFGLPTNRELTTVLTESDILTRSPNTAEYMSHRFTPTIHT